MANWNQCSIEIHDTMPGGTGFAAREYAEAHLEGMDFNMSVSHEGVGWRHNPTVYHIAGSDLFLTGGVWEFVGASQNDSVRHIIEDLRRHFPDATIEGSITTEVSL